AAADLARSARRRGPRTHGARARTRDRESPCRGSRGGARRPRPRDRARPAGRRARDRIAAARGRRLARRRAARARRGRAAAPRRRRERTRHLPHARADDRARAGRAGGADEHDPARRVGVDAHRPRRARRRLARVPRRGRRMGPAQPDAGQRAAGPPRARGGPRRIRPLRPRERRRVPGADGGAPMSAPIRVVVVDDQTLVRQGIRGLLELADGVRVTGEAADGAEALELLERETADVVLLDIRMPGMDGIATLDEMSRRGIAVPALVLTTFDDAELVLGAVRSGARGYLLKDVTLEQLADAVRTIAAGGTLLQPALTERLAAARIPDPHASGIPIDRLTSRE